MAAATQGAEAVLRGVIARVAKGYAMVASYAQEQRLSALEEEVREMRSQLSVMQRRLDTEEEWVSAVAVHYVPRVAGVTGVRAVFVSPLADGSDIVTIVSRLNSSTEEALYAAEYEAMDALPDGPFDFRIIEVGDSPMPSLPAGAICVFDAAGGGHARS